MNRKRKNLNAYLIAYGLKKYRNVKIYPKIIDEKPLSKFTKEEKKALTVKGKRWYIYFDYVDPNSGKFTRQAPITAHTNRNYPDFDDRFKYIHELKKALLERLEEGYSPYEEKQEAKKHNIIEALDFALDIKKDQVGKRTYEGYNLAARKFKAWLKDNYYQNKSLEDLTRRIANTFLDHIAKKTSNRSRNNYKNALRALFSLLVEHEYLEYNVFDKISNLKATGKRDPTYSNQQVKDITAYLKENDKVLLMFIYFVSYLFWRPKENCRLRVKDINLEEKLISVPTKTKGHKTKRIPDILIDDLTEYLQGANPQDLVFTPTGPGQWDRQLDNRRHYFSDRYRKVKKDLGLMEYSIYSFRHTYTTRVYKNLLKQHPKGKALDILAGITGHTSQAIQAYIHVLDAGNTEDYSDLLE